MLFEACSKEELHSPIMSEEQTIHEITADCENTMYDGYISLEDARKDLESILADFSTISKCSKGEFSSRKIADCFTLKSVHPSLSKSAGTSDTTRIHIFNFEDNGGFAIMSATQDMPSLLAITDGGNIDTNEVIEDPGLVMFLSNLEGKPILPSYTTDPDTGVGKDSQGGTVYVNESVTYSEYKNKLFNPVGGFCSVHWDQDYPYNKYCPEIDNKKTITGCVATACAQLMSIYQHPKSYNGYNFNWSDMISGNDTDAIARLMQQIGLEENTDMSYGVEESGADPANIPRTFRNFGYSSGGTLKAYNKNEVVNELKNGYCVLLGGFSHKKQKKVLGIKVNTSYEGGHRWLAHGLLTRSRTKTVKKTVKYIGTATKPEQDFYSEGSSVETADYILCNFGWGDHDYNGYYLGDVFAPIEEGPNFKENISKSDKDYKYQYKITAVTGIRK